MLEPSPLIALVGYARASELVISFQVGNDCAFIFGCEADREALLPLSGQGLAPTIRHIWMHWDAEILVERSGGKEIWLVLRWAARSGSLPSKHLS